MKKSGDIKNNPLIASGALAISEAFDLPSISVSSCKRLLKSYSGDPVFSSDLLASLGTIEFRNGNLKKAKEYYRANFDVLDKEEEAIYFLKNNQNLLLVNLIQNKVKNLIR